MESLQRFYIYLKDLVGSIEYANPMIRAAAALLVLFAAWLMLRIVSAVGRRMARKVEDWQGTRIHSLKVQQQEILSAEEVGNLTVIVIRAFRVVLAILVVVVAGSSILALFSWTERLAAAAFGMALETLTMVASAVVGYLPSLLLLLLIFGIAWYLVRLVHLVFNGIESERIRLRGFYPEWAMPTYHITRILIFAFALVMAFPYLPGAGSPAFQGVSIFIGVLFSLGSTSAVANVVAGIVITYMRAFKIGDVVEIADATGIVVERSLFVTRLRTPKNVEVSVPNSKVLAGQIVNLTAMARTKGLILHTTVGIGYDVPRLRVHELLIAAANATEGVSEEPPPFVRQDRLGDFAVDYELNASIRQPHLLPRITSELHGNILDAFNEAEVEIMSPAYTALRDGNQPTIPGGAPES